MSGTSALRSPSRYVTSEVLREAITDLARANRRIERLLHAMRTVEDSLLADPNADVVTKSLAAVLRDARGSR